MASFTFTTLSIACYGDESELKSLLHRLGADDEELSDDEDASGLIGFDFKVKKYEHCVRVDNDRDEPQFSGGHYLWEEFPLAEAFSRITFIATAFGYEERPQDAAMCCYRIAANGKVLASADVDVPYDDYFDDRNDAPELAEYLAESLHDIYLLRDLEAHRDSISEKALADYGVVQGKTKTQGLAKACLESGNENFWFKEAFLEIILAGNPNWMDLINKDLFEEEDFFDNLLESIPEEKREAIGAELRKRL